MFSFRWKTLEKCVGDNDTLAAWEIAALFRRRAGVDELSVDRDAAIEWYITQQVPEESRDDYRAEPQMAEDEMLEGFASDLTRMIEARVAELDGHYPLALDEHNNLLLKPLHQVTGVGSAYLGLQFYRAWSSGLIEVEEHSEDKRDEIRRRFNAWFPQLFEILAGYAVSGDHKGVPHLTAHCRSSLRLHKMLTRLCANIGAGKAKRYDDWTLAQKASNDGGIDCLVHRGGPGMPGNAYLVLVGATIQSSQIDRKILGEDGKRRFSDYFAERPAAFQSALVRPTDTDPLTTEKCRVKDCLLYSYDEIWKNIGKGGAAINNKRYFYLLDARIRALLEKMDGATLVDDFDNYKLNLI